MKIKKIFIVCVTLVLCMLWTNTKVEANESTYMTKYLENTNTIAKQIRDNTIKRNNAFEIYSKIVSNQPENDDTFYNFSDELVQKAMSEELADTSSAGDYLKHSWDKYNSFVSWICLYENERYTYYLTIRYKFDYYTTYSQEQKLNEDVSRYIKKNINKSNDSDLTKISKIYSYIINNVSYDEKNKSNDLKTLKYTAYGALENKKALCQGYSTLVYKMLKESGIDEVRIINNSTHAWNIVKIGNLYYNLDATWDSKLKSYKYFLKGTNTFDKLNSHRVDKEYLTSRFKSKYPISRNDYRINQDKIKIIKLKSKSKRKLKISWKKLSSCNGYVIEYSTNSKFKNSQKITIKNKNTTSKTIKNLKAKKKYYVRIRTYKKINGQKYYSRWSSIKTVNIEK